MFIHQALTSRPIASLDSRLSEIERAIVNDRHGVLRFWHSGLKPSSCNLGDDDDGGFVGVRQSACSDLAGCKQGIEGNHMLSLLSVSLSMSTEPNSTRCCTTQPIFADMHEDPHKDDGTFVALHVVMCLEGTCITCMNMAK